MKGSIYNLIENDLQNLSLQTALLESCDWDEALLEEFSSFLSMAFHFVAEESPSYDEGIVLLKETFELNGWTNGQYNIVIQLIETHAEEIQSFMMLEEQ